MVLHKLFGFQKTEDIKNEGSSLLSFKLLNLAIILSITNLMLSINRHRNLAFLLGEDEDVKRYQREIARRPAEEQKEVGEDSDDQNEGGEAREAGVSGEDQERVNYFAIQMSRRLEYWNSIWRWWHYTTVYLGFTFWFFLPFAVVVSTLVVYPFMTVSLPTILFLIGVLVIMGYDASTSNPYRAIYKPIGTIL
jgi:hypothetical protein